MRKFAAFILIALASCTKQAADGAPASGGSAGSASGGTGGGAGARGAPGGGGGRSGPSIVLGVSDVYTVARGTIETTTAISGDLRPIEEISVRSRVEGDLTAVLVREGEPVTRGAVLARFDTIELDAALSSAQADVAAARADAATADWNAEQSRELFKAGAISEQALKAAEQSALAAKARLASAQTRLNSAQIAVRDAQVLAPATGTISQRLVQTGERASRGAPMFVLVRDDSLEFTAALPARSAMLVKAGQEVRFAVDGRSFVGRVARVSPAIDPASRSVAIYVRIPNRTKELKANAFASGRVVSNELKDVLVVPITAIRRSRQDDATFVYRIEGDQINVAPVKVGVTDEARGIVEIVEGIDADDRIVVGNVGTIGRGMKVQVLNADAQGRRGGGGGGRQ